MELVGDIKIISNLGTIFIIYWCITNYPKFSTLKQNHLLSHSFCVRNRSSLDGCLKVSLGGGCSLGVCWTYSLLQRLNEEGGGGTHYKLIGLWAGFSYSLVVGFWASVTDSWLEATFSFLSCGPPIGQLSTWQLAFLRVSEQGMQAKAFCNLILEVTHCSLCLILFARSKSVNLAHTHSKRVIAQGYE